MSRLRPLLPTAVLILAFALGMGGCASHETAPPTAADLTKRLTAHPWQVTDIHGRPVLDDTTITLTFGADGRLKGNAGCNEYGGSWTLEGETISLEVLKDGDAVCGAGAMEQEYTYLLMLPEITTLEFDDETLLLKTLVKGLPIVLVPEGEDGGWLW